MKTDTRKTARGAFAALLLCSACGVARAEQPFDRPATTVAAAPMRSSSDEEREEQAAAALLAGRRQEMIDLCEQGHGSEIDCERETDTELRAEGLPPGAYVIRLGRPRLERPRGLD